MWFYSFYTSKWKEADSLVYRTENGWSPMQINMKFFETKAQAEKDFFQLLFDNENFRQGEYFDSEKGKTTKKKSVDQPEVNKEVYKIPAGFTLEPNKVYNLDCLTFMKSVPDKYIDYCFTSPPYNVGERTSFGERNAIYKDDEDMYNLYNDKMTKDEYEKWLFDVIDEMLRITKKHIFMNIQMLSKNKLTVFEIFHRYKHKIKEIFIWNKTIASPNINKKIVCSAFEFIFCFSNDKPELRVFEDGKFASDFRNVVNNLANMDSPFALITGLNSSQNEFRTLNKATFPLYLPRIFMKNFGKDLDIWFDPFSGTGTTFHAAELEGKLFIGTELDKQQCEVTNKRIWIEQQSTKLFNI